MQMAVITFIHQSRPVSRVAIRVRSNGDGNELIDRVLSGQVMGASLRDAVRHVVHLSDVTRVHPVVTSCTRSCGENHARRAPS